MFSGISIMAVRLLPKPRKDKKDDELIVRMSYNGNTLASQARNRSSILLIRS